MSAGLYFQYLSGRSSRSESRFFCSSSETNIATLMIVVPSSTSSFSNALISSYRAPHTSGGTRLCTRTMSTSS